MSYKVTFNGGTREEVKKALESQTAESVKNKSMTEESKSSIMKLIDALPGTHLAGTIQDNNNGSVSINVTSRTVAEAELNAAQLESKSAKSSGDNSNANRPMEGRAGNEGGASPARSTTGSK